MIFKLELQPTPKMIRHQQDGKKVLTEDKIRVYIFFGTRPEIIKTAPVIRRFQQSHQFGIVIIFTGQHLDLIHPFLEIFEIKVDVWFDGVLKKIKALRI